MITYTEEQFNEAVRIAAAKIQELQTENERLSALLAEASAAAHSPSSCSTRRILRIVFQCLHFVETLSDSDIWACRRRQTPAEEPAPRKSHPDSLLEHILTGQSAATGIERPTFAPLGPLF